MGDVIVCAVEDKHVPAGRAEGAQLVSLGTALAHEWSSDAHVQACHAPHGRRVVKADRDVTMTAFLVDIDAPSHSATPEWRRETRERIESCLRKHPGFAHETRGGARLVWRLQEPWQLTDPRAWSARYLATLAYLARRFGIEGDASCADFTRLFRCPLVLRDGQPTQPLTFGDAADLGAAPEPEAEDWASAAQKWPRLFEWHMRPSLCVASESAPAPALHIERPAIALRGALFELVSKRGDIRGELALSDGTAAFHIKCPRAARHSAGTGDEAILIPSSSGGPGWVKCHHDHCSGLEPADWLAALGVTTRVGTVKRTFINPAGVGGVRLGVELTPDDGNPMPYLRVSNGTGAWDALWRAAGVEVPSDLDHKGDFGAALDELLGCRIAVELEAAKTRRILRADASERAAA